MPKLPSELWFQVDPGWESDTLKATACRQVVGAMARLGVIMRGSHFKTMFYRASFIGCVLVAASATLCPAQVQQTVQLPTFSFFTVSTTVSVPDSGSAFLGGVKRARYGMTSRGTPGLGKVPGLSRLFSNRGRGASLASSGASVTATITDHAELDAALLSEAAGIRTGGAALTETDRKALILSSHIGRPSNAGLRLGVDPPRESVAAIRLRNEAASRVHQAEMQGYWQRGQNAESLKRWGAARVSYDVIVRRGSGELRDRAVARLAQLRAATTPAKKGPSSNVTKRSVDAKDSSASRTLVPARSNRLP